MLKTGRFSIKKQNEVEVRTIQLRSELLIKENRFLYAL